MRPIHPSIHIHHPLTPNPPRPHAQLKTQLVEKAEAVSRGLEASPEQQEDILQLVQSLEKKNPCKMYVSRRLFIHHLLAHLSLYMFSAFDAPPLSPTHSISISPPPPRAPKLLLTSTPLLPHPPQPNRPTASPLITARWRLIYTTSESILGKTRPAVFRPIGPIYQFIDLAKGTARYVVPMGGWVGGWVEAKWGPAASRVRKRAGRQSRAAPATPFFSHPPTHPPTHPLTYRNEETIRPIPFLPPVQEAIDATIEPSSNVRVKVFFQRLMIGPINVKFQSENYLDTTFLDQDMRISR